MTKWGELPMGRCSLLVGLGSSSQSLDQLALMFREFWRISWRFWGAMSLTWLSLPVSIHKRGVRPAVFAKTAVALVEGGGKPRHSWHPHCTGGLESLRTCRSARTPAHAVKIRAKHTPL